MPMSLEVAIFSKRGKTQKVRFDIKRIVRLILKTIAGVVLVLTILAVSLVIWGFNNTYRQCVALPNGLFLGYSAVFDLEDPYLTPNGVIKFADGTPLVDMRHWNVFVSQTSAYGLAYKDDLDVHFAWRADIGLVHWHDNPEAFDKIFKDDVIWNFGEGAGDFYIGDPPRKNPASRRWRPASYGPIVLMRALAKRPEFEMRWCTTRLFRW